MGETAIPWADKTWNVTRGCTPASEGCAHCYARRYHERFAEYRGWGPWERPQILPEKLNEPKRWREPSRVFVCAQSDLFHEAIPVAFINAVIETAADCPQHTFIFLTKRAWRMAEFIFPPNAWAGVSIENQARADERLPALVRVDAPVRFVSCEPLLGWIDVWEEMPNWIIVGAESGLGHREMREEWVRNIRDHCTATSTPFFYKQAYIDGKKVEMPELDGEVWKQWPV